METSRSNVIPFRRHDASGQARLPLAQNSRPRPPLDERRIAHRQRMLEFLRGQSLTPTIRLAGRAGYSM